MNKILLIWLYELKNNVITQIRIKIIISLFWLYYMLKPVLGDYAQLDAFRW